MKTILITQARIASSRLPRKILKTVNGKTFLEIHLERIKNSKELDEIIVATTFEEGVEEIIAIAKKLNIKTFQGSIDDVLDRYYQAAKLEIPEYVVRVTSDCPLIDPGLIDEAVIKIKSGAYDFISNNFKPTLPHGLDVEVMTFQALEVAWKNAKEKEQREHVTPYIRRNSTYYNKDLFKAFSLEEAEDNSKFRITLDYIEDEDLLREIISKWGFQKNYSSFIQIFRENPMLFEINKHLSKR